MTDVADATQIDRFPRRPGSLRVASVAGVPIDLHWSCAGGGVLLSLIGIHGPAQVIQLIVGYIVVLLAHEGGHALAARRLGRKVFGIRLAVLSGQCVTESPIGARAICLVYSAGLLTQVPLFVAALVAQRLQDGVAFQGLYEAFTTGNAFVFLCSAIPQKYQGRSSDGGVLLQLAIDCWHGRTVLTSGLPAMNAPAESPLFDPRTPLLSMPSLVPADFVHGVELLNDRVTPAEFVAGILQRHLRHDPAKAFHAMVTIHNQGGLLIPFGVLGNAERAAAAVMAEAEAAGHPLVCRAVSVQAPNTHTPATPTATA